VGDGAVWLPYLDSVTSSLQTSSSSSSSTGTTAHRGLWPVEQDPSSFSYLSPTLSIIVKSIQLFPLFDFRNNKFLLCGVVSPTPNPQRGGPVYPFSSGSSPLTCPAWEALPVAYATSLQTSPNFIDRR
jgi:hypothetical protein